MMARSVFLTAATFPANRAPCTMTLEREMKSPNLRNDEATSPSYKGNIIEKRRHIIPYIAPQKESSVTKHISDEYWFQNGVRKVKERMSSMAKEYDSGLEELIMIDLIQRLGLEYFFRKEIHVALQRHNAKISTLGDDGDELHEVALRFRLLRQGGYNVPIDCFNRFRNCDKKFKQELCHDIKGLLNLFEASTLRIQGEDMMDEADEFSEQLLKAYMMNFVGDPYKARFIGNTLRTSFHKCLARVYAKNFLRDFSVSLKLLHGVNGMRDWMDNLLDIARMDFEVTQTTQQHELLQISRWGEELNSTKQLNFARMNPFKWYVWSLGTFPGPNMAKVRVDLAKPVSFVYIIDDIFDVYGTLDQLSLFTEAVNRWDDACTEQLPNYMRVCFKALRDMVDDISQKVHIKHGWNPKHTLQRLWADMCNAFLMEAKWFASGHLPTSTEYLKNGIVSSGIHAVLGHAFFLLGEEINSSSVDALNNLPPIISSTATIVRLWNDVGSDKDESRGVKDGSYVDCYMNEHKVSSVKGARHHVNQIIVDEWKRLNEEFLSQTSPFSTNFKEACLNFARTVPIMYCHDESHHLRSLEKLLKLSPPHVSN